MKVQNQIYVAELCEVLGCIQIFVGEKDGVKLCKTHMRQGVMLRG